MVLECVSRVLQTHAAGCHNLARVAHELFHVADLGHLKQGEFLEGIPVGVWCNVGENHQDQSSDHLGAAADTEE